MQLALKEFDFLQSHDDTVEESSHEFYPAPPAQFANDRVVEPDDRLGRSNGNNLANNAFNNSHKPYAPDLLRPVLTMPPVVLMGGPTAAPVTSSPIVEEPPSPAPNQMPMVEYPEDEYYGENVDDDYLEINVEVRYKILKLSVFICIVFFF